MEPWDGPAAIGFTDGARVGAVLDRNGLRPARYYITKDDLVVMASEAGVLDIPADRVLRKGRLQPGRMIMVDTAAGHVFQDDELKEQIAAEQPYAEWLDRYMVALDDLPATIGPQEQSGSPPQDEQDALLRRQQAFGYTFEDLSVVLGPMARDGVEPVGSMGNDTPLAVLSERPQLLYNYFKQLFAQVTNPPIDSIWEALVTSQETNLGPEGNLLQPAPESCRRIHIKNPILTNSELRKLQQTDQAGFHAVTLPMLFPAAQGAEGLGRALDGLCAAADQAIAGGAGILILSDRGVNRENAPIPALLATAGLHHHLIRQGTRTRASLVVASAEPREIHHFALLIGYGAGAINPYLAYESFAGLTQRGLLDDLPYETAVKNYVKAAAKGIVKVMAKMGICTLDGYCGAQIFEAVGLNREVVDRYFTWTASRIGGIGLEAIAAETLARHGAAYTERQASQVLEAGGVYQWRQDGEYHLVNPGVIHKLQQACRHGDYPLYQEYAQAINDHARGMATLRGLLELKYAAEPVPLDEVEPVEAIVRRFKTGAMSYGSISSEAHEALAIAMNRLGGKSNSGEGGEDPERWRPGPDGESRSSAIKQVASGRFGVTSAYLVNATELQIKMAQGAKPGEGGQLPGRKVYPWIARVRHSTPGVGLISPPPHHDIYSIEDLAQLIYDLKNANHHARISVKLVSEVGVGTIAAGVAKGHADVVLVSGHDGGTGASPQTSIKHAGLPWELAVAETHQTLVANNLRSRIVVETDGQLRTGRDVVVAALLGAEEFGFATAPLLALGCIMMRVCHLDTCPVGIATQNPELRQKFAGDPEHVMALMRFLAQDVRELMAKLGFRTFNEMIGRADRLAAREALEHWKARGLDFSRLLLQPDVPPEVGRYCQIAQNHGLEQALDNQVLLDLCRPAITGGRQVEARLPIRNTQRTVGTILGSEITRHCGPDGLPDDSIRLTFQGSAGLSFGAFIPSGLTLILEGDANDHVGKGLSGGKIVVRPPAGSTFIPEDNIIIGNVALYGATSGELYVHGMAGERFAVRNSGAVAVVEAVGDHGCEYMTGGRVVVLGPTGRNFAAGMSGGIAYVLDEAGDFATRCNQEMVLLTALDAAGAAEVQALIRRHIEHTGSGRGQTILAYWDELSPRFVKVYPRDYQRMVEILDRVQSTGLTGDDAIMAAFQENIQDAARLGGR